jgi:hypothetical protein
MNTNPENMNFHEDFHFDTETSEAANDNIEKTPELDLAEKLETIITDPKFKQILAKKLQENPTLATKLGLEENIDELSIYRKLDQITKDLAENTSHLIDVLELVALIQVNPKNLAKVPQKFAKVITQNSAFFDEMDSKLIQMTQDSNPIKKVAGYLLRVSLNTNPIRTSTKAVSYLSGILAITSEDEQAQAQIIAEQTTADTLLKSWTLLQVLNHNAEFRQLAYQIAADQYESHTQNQKAA